MTAAITSRTPRTHELKCWPEHFEAINRGRKLFEIRKNDRGYQVGDVLWLREFLPTYDGGQYVGSAIRRKVIYMSDFEQQPGYVVLGLEVKHTPAASEGRSTEPGPDNSLLTRVSDEADLCRNEGANDIANLLDEVAAALQAQSAMGEHPTERMRHAVLAEITTPGFFDMTPQDQANVLCLAVIHAANIRLSVDRGNGG